MNAVTGSYSIILCSPNKFSNRTEIRNPKFFLPDAGAHTSTFQYYFMVSVYGSLTAYLIIHLFACLLQSLKLRVLFTYQKILIGNHKHNEMSVWQFANRYTQKVTVWNCPPLFHAWSISGFNSICYLQQFSCRKSSSYLSVVRQWITKSLSLVVDVVY